MEKAKILEKLNAERERLTKELDKVAGLIRAAKKGATAAIEEYGRRNKASRSAGAKRSPIRKRGRATAARKRSAAVAKAAQNKKAAPRRAKKSPPSTAKGSKSKSSQ